MRSSGGYGGQLGAAGTTAVGGFGTGGGGEAASAGAGAGPDAGSAGASSASGGTGAGGATGGMAGAGNTAGFTGNPGVAAGDCCAAQTHPLCGDSAVYECVCGPDSYCCNVRWDSGCAADVTKLGCGTCGGDQVALCEAQVAAPCLNCACHSCTSQALACEADPGCGPILTCMAKASCRGSDCYQPATCQAVIDQYGGPSGASFQNAVATDQCGRGLGCWCP